MIFLLLSILSSTLIAILFKLQDRLGIRLFPVIVVNYVVATALGFVLLQVEWDIKQVIKASWFFTALAVGLLLIAGFFVIGKSIQKAGISVTIVASKMSVVVPILFSIIAFREQVTQMKVIGLLLALVGIVLTVYPEKSQRVKGHFILPVLLFLTLGLIDSLVKLGQTQVGAGYVPLFTAISFGVSAVIGIILWTGHSKLKDVISGKELLVGILIGLANWGSMFFMIMALSYSGLDSSVVFGVNNIGVISLSVLVAFVFFRERLSKINWVGVFVAVIAAWILTSV